MDISILDNFQSIETPRLTLRVHSTEDVDDMYILRSDADVMTYLDSEPAKDKSEIATRIKDIRQEFEQNKSLNLVIKLRGKKEAIGYMSLWRFDTKNHRAEIGYALKKKYWKQGIGTEAAIGLINFGFNELKLHSIMANINEDNDASKALLEKLGFQQEAYFREDFYFRGEFLNSVIYCLIKSDWEKSPIYRLP